MLSACTVDKRYEDYLNKLDVEIRADGRWKALIKKDYAEVYAYMAESYRDVVSLPEYLQTINSRIIWDKFDIMRTRCEEDICKVNIKATYHILPMFGIPRGTEGTQTVKENWLYHNREWYYLPPIKE